MAQRVETITHYVDDLDGSKAEGTVSFALNGTQYEIDLSKKNRTAFEKALAPYIASGRKVRLARGRAAGKTRAVGSGRSDLAEIRAWAQTNGHQVSDRGRLPAAVVEAYDAAH